MLFSDLFDEESQSRFKQALAATKIFTHFKGKRQLVLSQSRFKQALAATILIFNGKL